MKIATSLMSLLVFSYSLPALADPTHPLPEPSGLALLGIGAGAALFAMMRRKK